MKNIKIKILLPILLLFCFGQLKETKALLNKSQMYNFNFTISPNSSMPDINHFDDSDYKYAKIVFDNNGGTKIKIDFIINKNYGSATSTIGSSISFNLNSHNTVYVLPRFGMGCPSDKTYCFGVGTPLTRTNIIAFSEFGGSSMYGFRFNNVNNTTITITGYYQFYN